MNERVNYNQISPVYNSRYKQNPLTGIRAHLEKLYNEFLPRNILEVGCGTGHWLNIFPKNNSILYGADFSLGMLGQAKIEVDRTSYINADANFLPIKNNSIELIYVVNAIHHFLRPLDFIKDASKLISTGGHVCIVGIEIEESVNQWYMYDYFEKTLEIDRNRFPSFNELEVEMIASGFTNISKILVEQVKNSIPGSNILNDHFLDKKGASQLALLTDEEYQNGINKIKQDIQKAKQENNKIYFNTNLNFYAITGVKL